MSLTPPSTPPFSPTTIPPRPALSPIPATPPTSPPDPLTADSQYDWMAGGWEAHDGPDGRFWIDKERYRVTTRHPKDVLIPSLPREVWNDVVVLYTDSRPLYIFVKGARGFLKDFQAIVAWGAARKRKPTFEPTFEKTWEQPPLLNDASANMAVCARVAALSDERLRSLSLKGVLGGQATLLRPSLATSFAVSDKLFMDEFHQYLQIESSRNMLRLGSTDPDGDDLRHILVAYEYAVGVQIGFARACETCFRSLTYWKDRAPESTFAQNRFKEALTTLKGQLRTNGFDLSAREWSQIQHEPSTIQQSAIRWVRGVEAGMLS